MTALKDYIASLAAGDDPDETRSEVISIRLKPGTKRKLEDLSVRLGKKPTPTAQGLLEAAIDDGLAATS